MKLKTDVVIVGSGPGGAVMAKELSHVSGLNIILVDAGPYVLERFYKQLELHMTQLYWQSVWVGELFCIQEQHTKFPILY
jgi:choline dehydrogenase-like flavoprotein